MFGLLDTTTKSTTTRSPIGRPVAALLAAGLMTAAVGCSSDGDPASESADVESTEPSATRSTEQDRGSGDIDEPPADADSAAGDDSTGREVSDDIGGTRIVEHPGGITEVPVGIDSILALDEPSAAVLMELGTPPDVIYGSYLTASTPLLADELGIEFLPHNIEDPSIEAAAALAPDLIVGTDHPGTLRNYDNWSEVAPVVLIDYAGAWQEQIATAGEAIGADDVAAARTAALEAEIERVADRIATEFDSAPSISVIASLAQMPFFVPEVGTASGELFRALGLTRPETQRVEGDPAFPVEFFSAELLLDHDADFVFSLGGGIYEDASAFELFPALTGTTTIASGDEWLATHPFAIAWILEDIEAIMLDGGDVGTADDIVDRWRAYEGLGS